MYNGKVTGLNHQYNLHHVILTVIKALQAAYPEHQDVWTISPKIGKPSGYWKDINNQRAFFDQLASQLDIQKPEDWHRITASMVIEKGGRFIKKYYGESLSKGN
jgi:hypothetical protein